MTRITSNYSDAKVARIDAVRGALTVGQFQNAATMKEVRRLEAERETWGDRMGVNAGPIPTALAIEKTVELGFGWIQCSPERGWLDDKGEAAIVQQCRDAGLKVAIGLQEAGHQYDKVIANPDAFAQWAAGWYSKGASALLCLNEPNNPSGDFWKPKPDPTMAGAALICGAVLEAVRKVSADLPVYLPGWSPAGDALAPAAAQAAIDLRLKAMEYALGAFSGAGHHPYCINGPLTWGLPKNKAWNAFAQTPDVYAQAKADGCTGGMALSEYGCPSSGTQTGYPNQVFTEAIQEQCIIDYMTGFEQQIAAGIPIAYIGLSTAVDGDAATNDLEKSMGVFRADGTEKPAAAHLRAQALKPFPVAA